MEVADTEEEVDMEVEVHMEVGVEEMIPGQTSAQLIGKRIRSNQFRR